MTPGEAVAARLVLGPFAQWNPDIAIRYLPIVRIIREAGLLDEVTDIGSGPIGIAPYLKTRVTAVDSGFSTVVHPRLKPVAASVLDTPFADASRPCVISVDMLEHLPADLRPAALDELVRIARDLLVVAVPCGRAAELHDAQSAQHFRDVRGQEHKFLLEHVDNGLPSEEDLRKLIDEAMARQCREGSVELIPNANLRMRAFIVRRWIRRGLLDKVAWVGLTWLSPLLARWNGGVAYRQIAVVRFSDAGR